MNLFSRFIKIAGFVFFCSLILVASVCLAGMFLVFYYARDLPKVPYPLSRIIETPQTRIYASTGQILTSLGNRQTVPLNMVSENFINAVIATEDSRFFQHSGVDKLRTLKGLYITLFKAGKIQGGSTITQQLAKNLFFSFEKSYRRKFRELLVALQIEVSNTKEEILHAYVNKIYFGAGAHGIEKAARVFLGKSALDLTLPEASLLAGLLKSPTGYNPYRHYDKALKRREIVLKRMVEQGSISQFEAQEAMEIKPDLHYERSDFRPGSYFLDMLINSLIRKYGKDIVYYGGIRVFGTIDPRLQSFAELSISQGLDKLDVTMGIEKGAKTGPQGALVAIDTGSGAVKAIVGGRDYYESEFNRAVNSRRQPGSGFKPFLYYSAFNNLGLHPANVMTDRPVSIPVKGSRNWEPENFKKTFQGNIILKKALTFSINTIAAQLVEMTGPKAVVDIAEKCGIKSPLKDVYSVALGSSSVTPFEMASAYTIFANQGIMHEPFLVWRIEDAFGRVIFEHIVQEKRVLDPSITYQVTDMMKGVIDLGSGISIRKFGFKRPAAGKTGTTDGYKDAWFTGFTPTLSTSIWIGFDKQEELVDSRGTGMTGGRIAAPIWADFMARALKGTPERDFLVPDDIRFEKVNTVTGCSQSDEVSGEFFTVPLKPEQKLCGEDQ